MLSAGKKLQEERAKKSCTIEEIAAATKIRPRFLTAIEQGDYDKLPSVAYAQGFVKNYASFLGLPQKEIMALFRREFNAKSQIKVIPDSLTRNSYNSFPRRYLKLSLLFLVTILFAFLAYLAFQYKSMFWSPVLYVASPSENARVGKNSVVSGKTDPSASLFINNETVSISPNGQFIKKLSLFPGENQITIRAKNRFGKESVIERQVKVME